MRAAGYSTLCDFRMGISDFRCRGCVANALSKKTLHWCVHTGYTRASSSRSCSWRLSFSSTSCPSTSLASSWTMYVVACPQCPPATQRRRAPPNVYVAFVPALCHLALLREGCWRSCGFRRRLACPLVFSLLVVVALPRRLRIPQLTPTHGFTRVPHRTRPRRLLRSWRTLWWRSCTLLLWPPSTRSSRPATQSPSTRDGLLVRYARGPLLILGLVHSGMWHGFGYEGD